MLAMAGGARKVLATTMVLDGLLQGVRANTALSQVLVSLEVEVVGPGARVREAVGVVALVAVYQHRMTPMKSVRIWISLLISSAY